MKRIKLYNKINGNILNLNIKNIIQLTLDSPDQQEQGGITIVLDSQKTIILSNQEWSTCDQGPLSKRIKYIIDTNQPVVISDTWYSVKSIRSIVSKYNSARLKQGLSTLAVQIDHTMGLVTITPSTLAKEDALEKINK